MSQQDRSFTNNLYIIIIIIIINIWNGVKPLYNQNWRPEMVDVARRVHMCMSEKKRKKKPQAKYKEVKDM